jgi:hypothetical protein
LVNLSDPKPVHVPKLHNARHSPSCEMRKRGQSFPARRILRFECQNYEHIGERIH